MSAYSAMGAVAENVTPTSPRKASNSTTSYLSAYTGPTSTSIWYAYAEAAIKPGTLTRRKSEPHGIRRKPKKSSFGGFDLRIPWANPGTWKKVFNSTLRTNCAICCSV